VELSVELPQAASGRARKMAVRRFLDEGELFMTSMVATLALVGMHP
jgi:hypothetical protein